MTAPNPIDPAELRRLHEQGWGSNRIASHFRVCGDRVRRLRKELGLKPHDSRLPPERVAVLRAANARFERGGITLADAAREHDVEPNSLRSWRAKQSERGHLAVSAGKAAARKADAETRERTRRLIEALDRRRERAGGVPWGWA